MERKTPRRAGCSPPYGPTPWVGVGGAGGYVSTTRQICECIRALIAGEQTACRCAVAYALRWGLDGFFRGWKSLRLIFFHAMRAIALRGPYSFFFGEERIWKERRRAGRGGPRPTYPPPWVGVEGAGGIVLTTRQICECIRALIVGEQTACRFACAYEGAGVVWGVAWSVASALNGVTLLVGTRSGVGHRRLP